MAPLLSPHTPRRSVSHRIAAIQRCHDMPKAACRSGNAVSALSSTFVQVSRTLNFGADFSTSISTATRRGDALPCVCNAPVSQDQPHLGLARSHRGRATEYESAPRCVRQFRTQRPQPTLLALQRGIVHCSLQRTVLIVIVDHHLPQKSSDTR